MLNKQKDIMKNELLMPFIGENDSPKFTNGFECGQIWAMMQRKIKFNNYTIHKKNIAQIELICRHFLYEYKITKLNETWSILFANPLCI